MDSVAASVLRRIRVHGRGEVFTPRDFLALGTRRAVDRALARLTQEKAIRRLAQGLYDYPRVYKKLGIPAPNPDDVAAVLAAKTGSRVQVSGARGKLAGAHGPSPRSVGVSHRRPRTSRQDRRPGHSVETRQTIEVPWSRHAGRAGSPGDPRGRLPCEQRFRVSTVVPRLERSRPCTTCQTNKTRPGLEP
jgi:hypothetical protein